MREQYKTGVGLFVIFCLSVMLGAFGWFSLRVLAADAPTKAKIDCSEAYNIAKNKFTLETTDKAAEDHVTLVNSKISLKECLHRLVPILKIEFTLRMPFEAGKPNSGKFACIDAVYEIGAAIDLEKKQVVSSRLYDSNESKPHLCK